MLNITLNGATVASLSLGTDKENMPPQKDILQAQQQQEQHQLQPLKAVKEAPTIDLLSSDDDGVCNIKENNKDGGSAAENKPKPRRNAVARTSARKGKQQKVQRGRKPSQRQCKNKKTPAKGKRGKKGGSSESESDWAEPDSEFEEEEEDEEFDSEEEEQKPVKQTGTKSRPASAKQQQQPEPTQPK